MPKKKQRYIQKRLKDIPRQYFSNTIGRIRPRTPPLSTTPVPDVMEPVQEPVPQPSLSGGRRPELIDTMPTGSVDFTPTVYPQQQISMDTSAHLIDQAPPGHAIPEQGNPNENFAQEVVSDFEVVPVEFWYPEYFYHPGEPSTSSQEVSSKMDPQYLSNEKDSSSGNGGWPSGNNE